MAAAMERFMADVGGRLGYTTTGNGTEFVIRG